MHAQRREGGGALSKVALPHFVNGGRFDSPLFARLTDAGSALTLAARRCRRISHPF
jgi:hypothetical protein